MLAEVLIDEGDIVINSAPSYFVYSGLLDSFGADVRSVPDDAGGMPVDALQEMLEHLKESGELAKVKLIYTVSYFQNPSGISVAADRRAKIVELAERYSLHHRIVVLEDAAYRELRYDGPDLPSLKRYDADNRAVVYTTTFSKPFSPGMKTGWTILPTELVGPVLKVKGNQDFGSSNLNQALLDKVMADGSYDRQVARLKDVYRVKRDAMLSAIQEHFGKMPGAIWTKPDGGLYVWLQLPEGIDTGQFGPLFPVAMRHGVLYVPGALSYTEQPGLPVPKNCMRLSFGVVGERDIRKGIARLAAAVAEVAAQNLDGRTPVAAAR
jgi:2-aminoadipate transaminase